MVKLHLGSGGCILEGWQNYDINTIGGALPLNLEEELPFEDESADKILISHTICLIKNKAQLIKEMIRILKKKGTLEIFDNPKRFYTDQEDYRDQHSMARKDLLELLEGLDVMMMNEDVLGNFEFSEELTSAMNKHNSFYIKATKL